MQAEKQAKTALARGRLNMKIKLKTESISSKIRNETEMSTLATIIQHSFGSPSHGTQRRKRNKRNSNWKRRSKTVTADDMILYIENPKDAT